MTSICNNCNLNPCGCKDHSLTTPCGYTECSVGNERCDDAQCAECVAYCGTSFQVESPNGLFKIESGEKLDQVLQKIALMIVNGFGTCNADNVHHGPYNLYAQNITNTSVDVIWSGISSLTESFSVYYDTLESPSGWVLANSIGLAPAINNFSITDLVPDTQYKIKVVSTYGVNNCDSVEILITTLAV